jgi:predicted phage terminase large subunit-like protein
MTKLITPHELRILMRHDLLAFLHRVFLFLHPNQPFMPNWHIDAFLAKLEECRTGKCTRLILCQPPRYLKSICASVAFPAWVLGHDPTRRLMCLSYGQDLADKHARDCLSVVSSDWYQQLFPAMRLSDQRHAVAEFTTTMNGSRIATSIGGVVTGLGADFIIIDDPLKPDEALSESRRRATNEWIGHTLYSRINDKRTGCIIIVTQRLGQADPVGHLQSHNGEMWEVLSFPAIAEEPQTFSWKTLLGQFQKHRAIGDVLHPEREPLEQLEMLRRSLGEYNFACQYQQNPTPLDGGMVKEDWFKRYREYELPDKFELIIQSWDTASKPSELSDYSVCTTWGLKGELIYLLEVWRERVDYPNLKRAVQRQHDLYKPNAILIEDNASGTQLIQELRTAGLSVVEPCKPSQNKIMRLNQQTDLIESGRVYLREQAAWLANYLQEFKTFPKSRYADQVDSTSQALKWIKELPPYWKFMEGQKLYNAMAGKESTEEVELIAPPGCTTVSTRDGTVIPVRKGRVKVPKEEVPNFMLSGFRRA